MWIDDVFLASDYTSFEINSMRNGSIDLQGPISSDLRVQQSTNSTTAFTIQNQFANTIFNVDGTDPNNLVLNPSFERDLTSGLSVFDTWSAFGAGSSVSRDVSQSAVGNASLKITTGVTANAGATYPTKNTYPTQLAISSTYALSWYAKLSSGSFTDIKAGYARDGSTWIDCIPTNQTVVTGGWTRFTCTFATNGSAPNASAAIRFIQTAGSARTFWIDGIRLEKNTFANPYGNGSISLDATIVSPLNLRNNSDNTAAFLIQNTSGQSILNVDTVNRVVSFSGATGSSTTSAFVTIDEANSKMFVGSQALCGGRFCVGTSLVSAAGGTTYTNLNNVISADNTMGAASTMIGQDINITDTGSTFANTIRGIRVDTSSSTNSLDTINSFHAKLPSTVSNSLFAGNAIWIQNGAVDTFKFTNTGSLTLQNTLDSTTALALKNAGSQSVLNVDTAKSNVSLFSGTSGNIGTWTTTSAINGGSPAARYGSTSVVANGYVYVMGGTSNSASSFANNVYYAKVNADGTISSTWNSATNLPYSAYKATSFTANGYIYYIGGYDGTNTRSDVSYARINADGSLGAWQTAAAVTPGRSSSSTVYLNGYVYVIGGFNNSIFVGTTSYAKVNADGSVGTWQTATGVLPSAAVIARTSAVAANGYIYLMGGSSDNTPANGKTAVYYTQPNASTGDIGSNWSTSANSLPAAAGRTGATALVSNGNVYYMGGIDTASAVQTSIYSSALPAGGGDLAAWSTSSSVLGAARWDATSVVTNGYMYEIGGNSSSATTTSVSTIYYATTPRMQVAGSLDLVGLQNATLADKGSDQSTGSTGGSITAGNGIFVGALQVQGGASFNSDLSVTGNLSVGSILSVDSSKERVTIGPSAGDTTGAQLVLGNKTNSGDPTGTNGAMYYNSNTNTFRCFENSAWTDCLSRHKIVLGSDVINNQGTACTNTDITGLGFSVTSGNTYRWHAQIIYDAAATTTGSEWTATTPTTTMLSITQHSSTVSGSPSTEYYQIVNASDGGNCNSTSAFTAGNMAMIDGIAKPSANGTVQMRFASEVSSSAITAKAGSTLEWW
ncbi:MAG TPA: hypothetical protein VLH86_03890 [Patescibacteria group bacterium]|nr:hypothetical protein [Patescibacteria group bacterium]